MANVNFVYATQSAYTALTPKDNDAIYFIHDTQKIYKGEALITSTNVKFGTTAPDTTVVPAGYLYVYQDDANKITLWANDGTAAVQVGGGEATEVADGVLDIGNFKSDSIATAIGETATDTKLVTEKAVKDYVTTVTETITETINTVEGKIDGLVEKDPITGASVSTSATEGKFTLNFTRASGTNPVAIELDKEQYLLDAKVEERTVGEVAQQCLVLTVQVLDGAGGTTSREVVVPLGQIVQVDASTVSTTQSITVTTPVGNYTKGQVIPINNIQAILMNMLSTDSWPSITNPSISLSGTGTANTSLEVGSKITPSFSSNFSAGSYGQTANNDQVPTGITPIVWTAICTGQDSQTNGTAETPTELTTFAGTFSEITIADSTNVQVSVSATYTAAANGPKTYLGNSELGGVTSESKKIKAGTATKAGGRITGFRNMFYGRSTSATALTGDEIYGLTKEKAAKKAVSVTAQIGDRQVIVAYPASFTSADPTFEYFTLSWGPFEGFVKSTVQVHGAVTGQDLTNYTVWTYTAEAPLSAATQFRVTIK